MRQEGASAGRAEFLGILDNYLADLGFCSDMRVLLRSGLSSDPQAAGAVVKQNLLRLLPE